MTELVTNFERGQLNAHEPLNENFKYQNLMNQALKKYIDEINTVTKLNLPPNLISGGSIRAISRGGVVIVSGSGQLAKNINFGEVLIADMGPAFKNIGEGNAVFTGAVTGNAAAQLYVEYNSSRLIANTAMTKGQWLTIGGSYLTDVPVFDIEE
ncbi:TPA: hypothetical protein IXF72_001063 [Enterococcus faecium]|nr:hypothetical protein [Enterococcus faecium]